MRQTNRPIQNSSPLSEAAQRLMTEVEAVDWAALRKQTRFASHRR